MQSKKINDGYIIRLEKGEDLLESLEKFCIQNKIVSGWLSGLGGATKVKLSYFDLAKKEYVDREFNETVEVANLTGNIAQAEGKTVFHIHATFGRVDYTTLAGHISALTVGGTLELYIRPFNEQLKRSKDAAIGLNLLDLM